MPSGIHDMLLFPLEAADGQLTLLSNQQHLLRRFGQLDLLILAAGQAHNAGLRGEADRICFALDGRVDLQLEDRRPQSPSHGAAVSLTLDAAQPQGLLLPFGVACTLQAAGPARLLVLSTHSEPHLADQPA
ncbi:MAG: hypothetical protein KIT46_08520 [Anaerolineales bacterium]|nr:hypothetical protein [Anaerolineales bacterium]MCW5856074.1 hypothetical protein [Anaerolineales bacterium]